MELKTDSTKSISMLLVEDDDIILKLQSTIITIKFPEIMLFTAVNGRLGLELFKMHSPDIVISDINMSEMCGVQLAENIRALKPDIKIVVITGKSCEFGENKKNILRNSAGKVIEFDHVIVKPIDLSELYAVIEQCIDEISNR